MANPRLFSITQSEFDNLYLLCALIDKYEETAKGTSSYGKVFGSHGESGAKTAKKLKARWKNVIQNIRVGLAKDIIELPYHYALAELKKIIADETLLTGGFHKKSLNTYVLCYYLKLEELVNGEKSEKSIDRTQLNMSQLQDFDKTILDNFLKNRMRQGMDSTEKERKQAFESIRKKEDEEGKSLAEKIVKRKYKPKQVVQIVTHELHKKLKFVGDVKAIEKSEKLKEKKEDVSRGVEEDDFPALDFTNPDLNVDDFIDALPSRSTTNPEDQQPPKYKKLNLSDYADGYEFERADGQRVKYFFPVKDGIPEGKQLEGMELSDFVEAYWDEYTSKAIIIIPILQVQEGRQHFNTVVIYGDNIYNIEPRGRVSEALGKYNQAQTLTVAEEIKQRFQMLGRAATVHPLYIGHQALTNDIDCGAHHINYAELIAGLSSDILSDPKKLEKALEKAILERRKDDEDILLSEQFFRSQFNITHSDELPSRQSSEEELTPETGSDSGSSKSSEPTPELMDKSDSSKSMIEEDDLLGFGSDAKDAETIASDARSDEQKAADEKKEKSLQDDMHERVFAFEKLRRLDAMKRAKKALEAYIKEATGKGFSTKYKRKKTAELLVSVIDDVMAKMEDPSTSFQKNQLAYALACFSLRAAHANISDDGSSLKRSLKFALVDLYDCKAEFDTFHTMRGITGLFAQHADRIWSLVGSQGFDESVRLVQENVGAESQIDLLKKAKEEIEQYNAYAEGHAGTFKKHTRKATADLLIASITGAMEKIQNTEDAFEKQKAFLFAIMCLYACRESIHDKDSRLRTHVEQALAHLFDCRLEYLGVSDHPKLVKQLLKRKFDELKPTGKYQASTTIHEVQGAKLVPQTVMAEMNFCGDRNLSSIKKTMKNLDRLSQKFTGRFEFFSAYQERVTSEVKASLEFKEEFDDYFESRALAGGYEPGSDSPQLV